MMLISSLQRSFRHRHQLVAILLVSMVIHLQWLFATKPFMMIESNTHPPLSDPTKDNNSRSIPMTTNAATAIPSVDDHQDEQRNTTLLSHSTINSTVMTMKTKPIRFFRHKEKILYLLHIHKSGGSTMCSAAALNELRVNLKQNCNVQDNQRCCGNGDSLYAQSKYAELTHFEFVANEQDMYDAMDPTHYRYMVVLRNSTERYLSHWKHMCRETKNSTEPPPMFDTWWHAQPDNWNVRKLCGTHCQNSSKFQISRQLFQYTFDRLRLFDDVLLLEYWDTMYPALAESLGWTKLPPVINTEQQNHSSSSLSMIYPALGESLWDPFMSVLDDALYEWAFARYQNALQDFEWRNETKETMELYFRKGVERNCNSPCCSDICSTYR